MKITKIGHCCLVIEENGISLMTDPGGWSTGQLQVTGLDAILITHEHGDHVHVESLKKVIANNPGVRIITNTAVQAILAKEHIVSEVVGNNQTTEVKGIRVEGFGEEHGRIYENQPDVENTGYFIGEKLFYPGDSFYNPGKHADILALPVGGPWMKMSEALEYAKTMQPRLCFPVHDALFNDAGLGLAHRWPHQILEPLGITFVALKEGSSENF